MSVSVAGRTHCSPHRVSRHDCAGHPHSLSDVTERFNEDRHSRDPVTLDFSCNVPDRHMTHRSDGHQQQHVDRVGCDLLGPLGRLLLDPSLCSCSRKGIQRVG